MVKSRRVKPVCTERMRVPCLSVGFAVHPIMQSDMISRTGYSTRVWYYCVAWSPDLFTPSICISTASDRRWGREAWVQSYVLCKSLFHSCIQETRSHITVTFLLWLLCRSLPHSIREFPCHCWFPGGVANQTFTLLCKWGQIPSSPIPSFQSKSLLYW